MDVLYVTISKSIIIFISEVCKESSLLTTKFFLNSLKDLLSICQDFEIYKKRGIFIFKKGNIKSFVVKNVIMNLSFVRN